MGISRNTLVITHEGVLPAHTLLRHGNFQLWSGLDWVDVEVSDGGIQEVMTLVLANGLQLECTPEQHVVARGSDHYIQMPVSRLGTGWVCLTNGTPDVIARNPRGRTPYWLGWVYGCGRYTQEGYIELVNWKSHKGMISPLRAHAHSKRWTIALDGNHRPLLHSAGLHREMRDAGMRFGNTLGKHQADQPMYKIGIGNWMRPGRMRRMFARGVLDAAGVLTNRIYTVRLGHEARAREFVAYLQTIGVESEARDDYLVTPSWIAGMELLSPTREPQADHLSAHPGVPMMVMDEMTAALDQKTDPGPAPLLRTLIEKQRPIRPAAARAVQRTLRRPTRTPIYDLVRVKQIIQDGSRVDTVNIRTRDRDHKYVAGAIVLTDTEHELD